MGTSGDTKLTKINYRMQHNSALLNITGLIKRRIYGVCSFCFSIQSPKSDLSREEMVSDLNQSSCFTSSVVRSVGRERRELL